MDVTRGKYELFVLFSTDKFNISEKTGMVVWLAQKHTRDKCLDYMFLAY